MNEPEPYPEHFYKYRAVENTTDLLADNAVNALLNHQAIFSSRTNFNDLFDSKIELVKPTPRQLKNLKSVAGKENKRFIDRCVNKGAFTATGRKFISDIEIEFTRLIDSYAFFSVSKNQKSNLMWSHYASKHTGFCIEFKSAHIKAEKVSYQDKVPSINLLECIRLGITDGEELGEHVGKALRIKLKEWDYEDEYRLLAGNATGRVPHGKKFIKIPYDSKFVESVIFGCRMDDKTKKFIAQNMPSHVKFKQAKEETSTIEIVPWSATPLKTRRTAEL